MKLFTQGGWMYQPTRQETEDGLLLAMVVGLVIVVFTGACFWLAALAVRFGGGA